MKAAEIIAEIKELPPEDFAEVSAFVLKNEREDPALKVALQQKRESAAGHTTSHSYEQAWAAALTALRTKR